MRCKVIGTHAVDGVEPGGTVVIDDDARIRYLTRAGHIAPKRAPKIEDEEK